MADAANDAKPLNEARMFSGVRATVGFIDPSGRASAAASSGLSVSYGGIIASPYRITNRTPTCGPAKPLTTALPSPSNETVMRFPPSAALKEYRPGASGSIAA